MKKINVLYDATLVCNINKKNYTRSGIFFVAYNVLRELLKREDFNVFLYADDMGLLENVYANNSEFKECSIYRIPVIDNVLAYFSNLKSQNLSKGLLGTITKLLFSLTKRIKKFYLNLTYKTYFNDIDVYFSPARSIPEFITKKTNVKKYVILHDVIPMVNDYRTGASRKWFYNLIKSVNSTDKYFANSGYTKQDFIKYVPKINPANITVIPLSTGKPYFKLDDTMYINQIKRKYGIPTDKRYIFSLCNLDPRKNLIFAIKNFLHFVEKNKLDDFIFVLGGAIFKDFEEALNQNIKDIGEKQNRILRIGYVEDEDMSALYSGAEMFVYPSLYEGFGIPVLEAMKCGLPVICSNTTSLPEVVGDCGIQINPHSDEELINAMEKMYYDRDFRAECVRKGLERAKLFTWQKCVDVITDEIKKDLGYEQ